MSVTDTTTRPAGRPAVPPEKLEADGLIRVAQLAAAILRTLRNEDRRSYPSEKALRAYLTADGVPFASGDVGPALALLGATGAVERPRTSLGVARPGWLPSASVPEPELDPQVRLGRLILTVCGRDTEAELAEKLDACDEDVSRTELQAMLRKLWDAGMVKCIQLTTSYPKRWLPSNRGRPFDDTDLLAADIVAVLRSRDELGFEDDDQLAQWCRDAGVDWDGDEQWAQALAQLWRANRLERPRVWERAGAVPTWLKEPRPHDGIE